MSREPPHPPIDFMLRCCGLGLSMWGFVSTRSLLKRDCVALFASNRLAPSAQPSRNCTDAKGCAGQTCQVFWGHSFLVIPPWAMGFLLCCCLAAALLLLLPLCCWLLLLLLLVAGCWLLVAVCCLLLFAAVCCCLLLFAAGLLLLLLGSTLAALRLFGGCAVDALLLCPRP